MHFLKNACEYLFCLGHKVKRKYIKRSDKNTQKTCTFELLSKAQMMSFWLPHINSKS